MALRQTLAMAIGLVPMMEVGAGDGAIRQDDNRKSTSATAKDGSVSDDTSVSAGNDNATSTAACDIKSGAPKDVSNSDNTSVSAGEGNTTYTTMCDIKSDAPKGISNSDDTSSSAGKDNATSTAACDVALTSDGDDTSVSDDEDSPEVSEGGDVSSSAGDSGGISE
jgi:hypothetical protein